jgi:hypothetical protein
MMMMMMRCCCRCCAKVSAKTADGVEEAFMKTAASIWEKMTNGRLVIKGEEVLHPLAPSPSSLTPVTLPCTPL